MHASAPLFTRLQPACYRKDMNVRTHIVDQHRFHRALFVI
jgi:hypothetical protein